MTCWLFRVVQSACNEPAGTQQSVLLSTSVEPSISSIEPVTAAETLSESDEHHLEPSTTSAESSTSVVEPPAADDSPTSAESCQRM